MTIVKQTFVRLALFAVIALVGSALINASDSTDPLGPGLLLFLTFVIAGFVWGIVDGLRSSMLALATWPLVAAGVGLLLELELALTDDTVTSSIGSALDMMVFTLFLVGIPALVGVGLGALVGSMRAPRQSRPESAQV